MILDTLAAASKERAGELVKKYGLNALRREAEALPQVNRGFAQALKKQGLSFICEVKKPRLPKGLSQRILTRFCRPGLMKMPVQQPCRALRNRSIF